MKKSKDKNIATTTLYIEEDLYIQLKVITARMKMKVNDCLNQLIREFVEKNKKLL